MGSFFNFIIDNINATFLRILALPLSLLIIVDIFIFLAITFWLNRFQKKHFGSRRIKVMIALIRIIFLVVTVAFLIDYKMAQPLRELRELRSQTSSNITGILDLLTVRRHDFLVNYRQAEQRLEHIFGSAKIIPLIYDESADAVFIRLDDPLTYIYLAVIDLNYPGLKIRIDPEIRGKWLTSKFAQHYNCSIAINGEAGRSPRLESGLGKYRGNLIHEGKAVLLDDNSRRPFMSFDRNNLARYFPQAVVDRKVGPEKYNTIWGRDDIVLNGRVTQRNTNPKPVTTMAINKKGDLLYLMIVDGRQPGYSGGLNEAETANILRIFGAYNGMACDAGGSSCLYLSKFSGIVSSPCDGWERPTYTHFGISREQIP